MVAFAVWHVAPSCCNHISTPHSFDVLVFLHPLESMWYEIYPQFDEWLIQMDAYVRHTTKLSMNCANRRLIFKVNLDNFVALFKRESIHDDLSEYPETNKKKY